MLCSQPCFHTPFQDTGVVQFQYAAGLLLSRPDIRICYDGRTVDDGALLLRPPQSRTHIAFVALCGIAHLCGALLQSFNTSENSCYRVDTMFFSTRCMTSYGAKEDPESHA